MLSGPPEDEWPLERTSVHIGGGLDEEVGVGVEVDVDVDVDGFAGCVSATDACSEVSAVPGRGPTDDPQSRELDTLRLLAPAGFEAVAWRWVDNRRFTMRRDAPEFS